MKLNLYLYKNEELYKKDLNIDALYDKTNARLQFMGDDTTMEICLNKYLKRSSKEFIFFLDIENRKSHLELINHSTYNIEVISLEYSLVKEKLVLEYELETEPNIINKIEITMKGDLL